MARGEMVRFMAENAVENLDEIKSLIDLILFIWMSYQITKPLFF